MPEKEEKHITYTFTITGIYFIQIYLTPVNQSLCKYGGYIYIYHVILDMIKIQSYLYYLSPVI